jgi:hypothetical protein
MHPLREVFGGNREAGNVAAWICNLAESIQESQSLKHSRVDTDTDRGIARFNSPYRRATRKCSLGYNSRRQATSAPGVPDIQAELVKAAPNAYGGSMWSGH